MNPAPEYGHPHKDVPDNPETDTPINAVKMIKKSAINWVVPSFCVVTCLGFLALADSHFQGMLDKYQTKTQAEQLEIEHNAKEDRLDAKIVTLQQTADSLDKKLDHLQYSLDWMQSHQQHAGTPHDQP